MSRTLGTSRTLDDMVHPQFGIPVQHTTLTDCKVAAGTLNLVCERDDKRPPTWLSVSTGFGPCEYAPPTATRPGFWTDHNRGRANYVLNPEFVLTANEFATYAKVVMSAMWAERQAAQQRLADAVGLLGAPRPI